MQYAIEVIGYGKRTRYIIKQVLYNGTNPVDYKIYATEQAARDAANALGINITACGDLYSILAAGASPAAREGGRSWVINLNKPFRAIAGGNQNENQL